MLSNSFFCRFHVNIVSNLLLAINKRASLSWALSRVWGCIFVSFVRWFFFFSFFCCHRFLSLSFVRHFIVISFERQSRASDKEIEEYELLYETNLSREDQNRKAVRDYLLKRVCYSVYIYLTCVLTLVYLCKYICGS